MHSQKLKDANSEVFVGGYAVMQLGTIAMKIFAETETLMPNAGETFYAVGVLVALVMWKFGLVWLFFAPASIGPSRFRSVCWAEI